MVMGFKYIERVWLDVPGNFVFRNITMEDAGDVFAISQTCTSCDNWVITSLPSITSQRMIRLVLVVRLLI